MNIQNMSEVVHRERSQNRTGHNLIKLILVHAGGTRTQSTGQDQFIESAFRSMYKCTELKKISTLNINSVSASMKLRVRVSATDRIQTVDAYCLQTEFHHAS